MKPIRWWFISMAVSILLLVWKVAVADTTLLNPAALEVGAKIGEYLVVKESCPDPSKTNCQASEKVKYITAIAGRTGKIEFAVNLTDNFELDVNADWRGSFHQQIITLSKADDKNKNSLFIRFPGRIKFNDEERDNISGELGWQDFDVNNIELSAKSGIAFLNINGTPFKDAYGEEGDTVTLDTSQPYIQLVIGGINDNDRLFEVTLKGGSGTAATTTTGSVAADTILLDPAILQAGDTIGESLVVKESCPDPSKTNCQSTEKLKYVTAVPGRTGIIEFVVNLTDNFKLDVNADWEGSFHQQAITLSKADDKNEKSLFIRFPGRIKFNDEERDNISGELGWQDFDVNNIELSAKNEIAFLNINGTPFKNAYGEEGDTVTLDTSQPYVKLVIGGIKDKDRLFEVTLKGVSSTTPTTPTTTGSNDFESGKQAGIQQCVANPASCGITVTGGSSSSSSGHATYNPAKGEVYIPFIDVPGAFGGIQTYEVYLVQQPATFTFDLDLGRVVLK